MAHAGRLFAIPLGPALLVATVALLAGQRRLAWPLLLFLVGAVAVGPVAYANHEAGHAFALGLCRGVHTLQARFSLLSVSLAPAGTVTAAEALGVALAGPGACALIGFALLRAFPDSTIGWWYVAHLAFLLPVFGDGRSIARAMRG